MSMYTYKYEERVGNLWEYLEAITPLHKQNTFFDKVQEVFDRMVYTDRGPEPTDEECEALLKEASLKYKRKF